MFDKKCNCWKYSVISYIILFCVTAVVNVVTTSYILLRRYSLRFFVNPLRISLYSSYAAPILVVATAALGWHAVVNRVTRRKLYIKTFSILMAAVACVEIGFCVWAFMEKEDLGRSTTNVLTAKFPSPKLNSTEEWNTLQTQLQCCGIHESSDYIGHIPKSCSRQKYSGKTIHQEGCLYQLVAILSDDFNLASLIFLIVALAQLPGVFLSWCLSNRLDVNY